MTAGDNIGKITAEEMDERGAELLAAAYGKDRMNEYRFRLIRLYQNIRSGNYSESYIAGLRGEIDRWADVYIHHSLLSGITDTHALCSAVEKQVKKLLKVRDYDEMG